MKNFTTECLCHVLRAITVVILLMLLNCAPSGRETDYVMGS